MEGGGRAWKGFVMEWGLWAWKRGWMERTILSMIIHTDHGSMGYLPTYGGACFLPEAHEAILVTFVSSMRRLFPAIYRPGYCTVIRRWLVDVTSLGPFLEFTWERSHQPR